MMISARPASYLPLISLMAGGGRGTFFKLTRPPLLSGTDQICKREKERRESALREKRENNESDMFLGERGEKRQPEGRWLERDKRYRALYGRLLPPFWESQPSLLRLSIYLLIRIPSHLWEDSDPFMGPSSSARRCQWLLLPCILPQSHEKSNPSRSRSSF